MLRGHFISQIKARFHIYDKTEMLDFIIAALKNVQVKKETTWRIAFVSEECGCVIKAKHNEKNDSYTLCTIIPIGQYTNYQLYYSDYANCPVRDYSKCPIIFDNKVLQEENILK